ncbi:type I-C CRISPR-associated protein Cas8c/Csd1 [Lacimicrobium alkaliphilum]|uniref:Type I-C CRISPR-associated protein Cas8c/Csd1 n=1 Tax=Lacimicrobium alkaliphilum TaxID=1526571 RepID=A0ABQ1RH24_9ALTE|nr:type I-C CRISPR-associated protein Cas8c/Csd1 [Lacimicrobium alkaliphilum]GGD66768.1 type I-C CRISPR-associated protein Cas8c/Csd1 [Lacimicrobium alkaliphilum]
MILQALCDYYDRKNTFKEKALAPLGFEEKEIPFLIVINADGKFINLEDTREHDGKKLRGHPFLVPKAEGRSGAKSYKTVNCLWDHYGYLLNQPKLDKPDKPPSDKDIEMAANQFEAFKQSVSSLNEKVDEPALNSVLRFLNNDEQITAVKAHVAYQEVLKIKGCNLTFKIAGEKALICQYSAIQEWVKSKPPTDGDFHKGICLVTGQDTQVVRLHNQVSGVNAKPAPFAAINESAYNSYGKDKGFNFPAGKESVFKYTTALSFLLSNRSPSKFVIGDTKYCCWSASPTPLEENICFFFTDSADDPEKGSEAIRNLYSTIHNGSYTERDAEQDFYVLGLAPNSARISVKLWEKGTVAEFAERFGQWFSDLEMDGVSHYGRPVLKWLLRSCALRGEDKNLSPVLISETARSILAGLPLPASLLNALLQRIKAEQGSFKHQTGYLRASLLKAYLNRQYRRYSQQQEVTVSLNHQEERIGYNLGRLFAVLEKLQEDANPSLNATIRDRYYSSASCTPKSVFGTLMRLSTHHLKKLEKPAFKVSAEKRIGTIMEKILDFPSHLNLEHQGLFALGYYHQKQDFYKKTEQGE